MCSYNDINHVPGCGNNKTLNEDLRVKMGFEGFVMSDWGAVYSDPKDYVKNGLDQEMCDTGFKYFTEAKLKSQVDIKDINTAVTRIMRTFIRFGLFDEYRKFDMFRNVSSSENRDFAQKGMEESTILLKNDGDVLPLKDDDLKNFLILGNAAAWPLTHGLGSGMVPVDHFMPPLWTFCDKYEIPRIDLYSNYSKACNEKTGVCLTYIGTPNTRDLCPIFPYVNNYTANSTYNNDDYNKNTRDKPDEATIKS